MTVRVLARMPAAVVVDRRRELVLAQFSRATTARRLIAPRSQAPRNAA